MISSVSDILDVYKRRGFINPQAATKCLTTISGVDADVIRNALATPDIEYLLDCFCVASGKIGSLITMGKRGAASWDFINNVIRKSIETVDEIWESQGRKSVLYAHAHERLRLYITECIWYYRTGGQENWRAYEDLVEEVINSEVGLDRMQEFLLDDAIYYYLPEFVNGITMDKLNRIVADCKIAESGFVEKPQGKYYRVRVAPGLNGWGCTYFVAQREGEEFRLHTASELDRLRVENPHAYEWLLDPANLNMCDNEKVYGVYTSGILLTWAGCGAQAPLHLMSKKEERDIVRVLGDKMPKLRGVGVRPDAGDYFTPVAVYPWESDWT